MKKQIFNLSIIGILLLTLFSCENLFSPKQDIPTNVIQTPTLQTNVATVKISSKMPRTVLPEAFTENTQGLTWKLTVSGESGTCYTEEWTDTEDGSNTAYQNMLADSFTLATGTYKFSLSVDRVGNDGKRVLYSIIESQEIKLGTNVLNFEMKEATGDSAAPGSIDFTLNFPANVVTNAIATLYKWNPSENDFETQSFKENVFSAESNFLSSVDYTNDSIPLGTYLLKIQLQKSKVTAQGVETINTYSCIVRVAPGLCSKGEYTLKSLNYVQLFNLSFKLNGGNFESGSSTPMTYNANECIDLPNPTKEGYDFAGWYTDEALQTPVQLESDNKYRITQDITLYAKWKKTLSLNYAFDLINENNQPVTSGASYSVDDNSRFATITVDNPAASEKVWSYLIKSDIPFNANKNYTISVDLKATEQTVVGIAAAETDMFFTVGNEWKTYSFETGYLKANSQNGISIGTGLSKTVYVSNLVITESTDQSNLPILSFYISKEGITSYLQGNPNNDIIQVEKTTESTNNNSGYKLTLNSTGVSLQLRDYISNTGLSKASFNMNSSNQNLKTSIVAKTTNSEQFAKTWNTPTAIGADTKTCNVFVPVYTANEEYIIDGILSEGQTAGDVIEISNYKIENITTLDNTGKVFAIKTDSTWNKSTTLPFTKQVTIQPRSEYVYDVLLMDSFESTPDNTTGWNECIRFLNTSEDTDNFTFTFTFTSENNNTTYKIENQTEEELTLNITLTDEYKVEIKDASIVSTWNELSDKITNTSISKFVIAENLTATKTIYVTKPIKITAQRDVKISRGKNDYGSAFTETFFIIDGVANGIQGSLELGSEDYKITVDGGKDDNITASGTLIWAYSQSESLTLKNCILQNNSVAEEGGAVRIEKPFTMYGGSITNCTASKTGGAVHIANGGSFTMYNNVTISNCTANVNGGAVHIAYGGVFNMESGTISDCTAPEGGALYIWQGDPNTVTMNDGTISDCTANSAGGAVYINKGNFTMNGGTISGCKAPSGAGVYVATGSLTVNEPSTIKNNICAEINCGASINGAGSVIIAGVPQNSSDITQNIINGEIELSYAEGLTYANDTLYISNAQGLATFRDIVNGTLTNDIKVAKNSSFGDSDQIFKKKTAISDINAELDSDIDINTDWVTIGKYRNDSAKITYSGTFDGKGKSIKFSNKIDGNTIEITEPDTSTSYAALFSCVSGTIKNLVVDGEFSHSATNSVAGICAVSENGTFENCVNKVNVNNTSMTGTSGIVGYSYGVNIYNCINLGTITCNNNSNVGGILGNTSSTSENIISKCINVGEIFGTSNISGILGTTSSSSTTISDCINLGQVTASNSSSAYASGITNPGANFYISNSINVGKVIAEGSTVNQGAITSLTLYGYYTNNYYDSNVNSSVVDSLTSGITGTTTNILIGSISLEGITTESWSFANGRYPLPDITETIPGGANGEIWSAVIEAAIPESTSTSGGE